MWTAPGCERPSDAAPVFLGPGEVDDDERFLVDDDERLLVERPFATFVSTLSFQNGGC
jgi:hypothetical protein